MSASALIETPAPLASVLPSITYFEIDSDHVGARFAVWVNLPLLYDREDIDYPVIYQPDGNKAAATTGAPFGLLRDDPINPILPFIQVCVGYLPDDAHRMLAVRARDLLPPGEPLSERTDPETAMQHLTEAGFLSEDDARLYLGYLRNPRADRFLAFIAEELDPALRARFRISENGTGLHGFSYGGLFASYAALHTDHFQNVGAGSPGILPTSTVLDRYDALAGQADRPTAEHLHITVCERELSYPSSYQELVGFGTVALMTKAGAAPIEGLRVTSAFTPTESHATGSAASYFSFLRECYAATSGTGKV